MHKQPNLARAILHNPKYHPSRLLAHSKERIRNYLRHSHPSKHYKSFEEYKPAPTFESKNFAEIKVAAILDPFSSLSFSFEFEMLPLSKNNWKSQLSKDIDFIFIESAWQGNNGEWQHMLTGVHDEDSIIFQLCKKARKLGIPIVFWNKEDPVHYKEFISLASLADLIFTTDRDIISQYREDLGSDIDVKFLPFCAQPAIHNPVREEYLKNTRESDPYKYRGDIAFAGSFFQHKYPERAEQTKQLLDSAKTAVKDTRIFKGGLVIFSRNEDVDAKYSAPKAYSRYIFGSLPYSRMLTAYRQFPIFLNVNSVTSSSSMCSRRIFELAACERVIIQCPNQAVGTYFSSEEIFSLSTSDAILNTLRALIRSPHWRDQIGHNAARRVWESHTSTHRAWTILKELQLEGKAKPSQWALLCKDNTAPRVSIVLVTMRPSLLPFIIEQACRQVGVEVQLVIVTHGFRLSDSEIDSLKEKMKDPHPVTDIRIDYCSKSTTLGECLNKGVQSSIYPIVAKFDDDDFYLPNYLRDQINTLYFSKAHVVGKQCVYMFDKDSNLTLLRSPNLEHRYTSRVLGATIVAWRSVLIETPFPHRSTGEDTQWMQTISSSGKYIYSADRFNFAVMRDSKHDHTWRVKTEHLLRNSKVVAIGTDHKIIEA